MTKSALIIIILGIICKGLLSNSLLDVYKKGIIELKPVREFGNNTDWRDPGFYKISSIAVSKKGDIFAVISNQHKICKFDSQGRLLTKFSQKGQGPGDTFYPGPLSILDDKYLLVSEYSTNRRISLFKLDGKFYKLIRTNYSVNNCIGLKNNKIGIMSISYLNDQEKISIFIRDIETNAEKCLITVEEKMKKIKTQKLTVRSPFQRKCCISKAKAGNLLIGFNDSKIISIYSPHGDKINSFELKMNHTPATGKNISKLKEEFIRNVHGEKKIKPLLRQAYRSFDKLFNKNLSLYSFLITDEDGNVLVFYYNNYSKLKRPGFQVYSPEGDYICDCILDFNSCIKELMDFRFSRRIAFSNKGLFGVFGFHGEDDSYFKIVKINFKKKAMGK